MSTPTIRLTTAAGTGVTYIPVDRYQENLTVQCIANGTITFQVDGTGDNILFDTATLLAANMQNNSADHVGDPTTAAWTQIIASGSASGAATTQMRCRAIRINRTAGTGTVTVTVNQGGGA